MTQLWENIILAVQGVYSALSAGLGYGWALLAFSVLMNILLGPLGRWAKRVRDAEADLQDAMGVHLAAIHAQHTGKERYEATQRLYKAYRYNPIYAIRQSMPAFVQVPMLLLAYYALSTYAPIAGEQWWIFRDLSQPDALLGSVNLLPFVMTALNIATAMLSQQTKREQTQALIIAGLFLALLYAAPSALLIYWTSNNAIGLLRELAAKYIPSFRMPCLWPDLSKPWYLLPLCMLVPPAILWSGNISYYSPMAISISSGVMITAALLVSFLVWLICRYIKFSLSFSSSLPIKTQVKINSIKLTIDKLAFCIDKRIFAIGYIILSIHVLYQLSKQILTPVYDWRHIVLYAVGVLIFAIYYIRKWFILNAVLAIIVVISTFTGLANFERENITTYTKTSDGLADNLHINMKNKPNIYYIHMESYQGLESIKSVYGIDSSEFVHKLEERGFTVYDNIYSSGYYTLLSLKILFEMDVRWINYQTNFDDTSINERNRLGGADGNNLLRILKENGYKTSAFYKGSSYYFSRKGKYLDETDVRNDLHSKFLPIWSLHNRLEKLSKSNNILRLTTKSGKLSERDPVKVTINFLDNKSPEPQFFFLINNYSNHIPMRTVPKEKVNDWIASGEYQAGIDKENTSTIEIIDAILTKDPDPVIILLGDHGSRVLHHSMSEYLNNPQQDIQDRSRMLKKFADDHFSILAAIRMPKESKPIAAPFSHANIFAKIFMSLNPEESASIEEHIAPTWSIYNGKVFIKDGQLENTTVWWDCPPKFPANLK